MKKNILLSLFAVFVSTGALLAVPHDLNDQGFVTILNWVYTSAENPDNLPAIIKTYYDRVQQGQYDIPYEDLQLLYVELSAIVGEGNG